MRMPNENDYIKVTYNKFIHEGSVLDVFGVEDKVYVKEKTDEYIIIASEYGIVEVADDNSINLNNPPREIKINKGESKTLTIPMTDNFYDDVTIKY